MMMAVTSTRRMCRCFQCQKRCLGRSYALHQVCIDPADCTGLSNAVLCPNSCLMLQQAFMLHVRSCADVLTIMLFSPRIIAAGGMRQLHWHLNFDEWQYVINVSADAGKHCTIFYQGPPASGALQRALLRARQCRAAGVTVSGSAPAQTACMSAACLVLAL